MNTILKNWSFIRAVRLMLGIFILAQGIGSRDAVYCLLGAFLTIMAIANIGCCGVNGCTVPGNKVTSTGKTKDITYEEVV